MKFASARSPMSPASPAAFYLRWGLAVTFIILATSQLILYEKFVPFIHNFRMFDPSSFGDVFAACMVISEVMALPFLLRMSLSPLFRIVSACSLMSTGIIWMILGYWSSLRPYYGGENTIEVFLGGGNVIIMPFGLLLVIMSGFLIYFLRTDFES